MVSVYLKHVNDTQPQPQHMHINDGTTSNLENFPNRSSMHVKVKKDTCNNKGDKYNVVIRITSNWKIVSYFSFAETHCMLLLPERGEYIRRVRKPRKDLLQKCS